MGLWGRAERSAARAGPGCGDVLTQAEAMVGGVFGAHHCL